MPDNQDPVVETPPEEELTVEIAPETGEAHSQLSDEEVEKLAETPADDEIQRYAKDAQKRIKNLRMAGQEWRRRVVQANKDLATATTLAEQLYRENQQLKGNVNRSEAALIEQALQRVTAELEQARARNKAAFQAQNYDEITASNEQIVRANVELDRLRLLKPVAQGPPGAGGEPAPGEAPAPPAQPPQPPSLTNNMQAWWGRNLWFKRDPEMTRLAFAIHDNLSAQGITEAKNPELYYGAIDKRMREKFPDYFKSVDTMEAKPTAAAEPEAGRRPVAVTGAQRVNGGANGASAAHTPRRVTLTESQVRIAKNLGLTPEQYAAQLVKEGKVNP